MKWTRLIWIIALAMPLAAGAGDLETKRHVIDGERAYGEIPCTRYAWTFEDGTLHSCFLAREMVLAGHRLPAGTHAHFDVAGRLEMCFLGKDTMIEGYLCRGQGHGFMTTFHPGGRLRLCWLKRPTEIQGVPCQRGTFLTDLFGETSGVYFHPDGRLKGCEVSREFRLADRTFARGDRVEFTPDGSLVFDRN